MENTYGKSGGVGFRTRCVSQEKTFPEGHIINPLLTKLVRYIYVWISTPSWSINMLKMNLANISCLIHNAYDYRRNE